MDCLLVFGARPNFMKIAPVYRALRARGAGTFLVHTGQHFDKEMSDDFMAALDLPEPDAHLGVGPGSQAWQMAAIMQRLEPVLADRRPDVTIVVGDVSSTLAAGIVCDTLLLPLAHVEAGLRSRDWTMPEERNRVLTDRLSRWLFTPSEDADANLLAEGLDASRIHMVGNVMVDSLDWIMPRVPERPLGDDGPRGPYGLVTLHRAGNVDEPGKLRGLFDALRRIAEDVPLLFPVHPRTRARLEAWGLDVPGVRLLPPLGYPHFVGLMRDAALVLTDSGGIQEETTVLGVPCLTLRENTERPITIEMGTNTLAGTEPGAIVDAAARVLAAPRPDGRRPPLWDGTTAERIADILTKDGGTA